MLISASISVNRFNFSVHRMKNYTIKNQLAWTDCKTRRDLIRVTIYQSVSGVVIFGVLGEKGGERRTLFALWEQTGYN